MTTMQQDPPDSRSFLLYVRQAHEGQPNGLRISLQDIQTRDYFWFHRLEEALQYVLDATETIATDQDSEGG